MGQDVIGLQVEVLGEQVLQALADRQALTGYLAQLAPDPNGSWAVSARAILEMIRQGEHQQADGRDRVSDALFLMLVEHPIMRVLDLAETSLFEVTVEPDLKAAATLWRITAYAPNLTATISSRVKLRDTRAGLAA